MELEFNMFKCKTLNAGQKEGRVFTNKLKGKNVGVGFMG
jgi:hypothetical protein